uniref:nickel-binding protein n=1 Tax=uncultured Draconibacterium sp. TaxID=1573823 RepID=UPI00321700B2
MPLFIDRHNLQHPMSAEAMAQKHLDDIKIQHKFNCRKLSYWYDEKRNIAFCLFEAPSRNNLNEMHKYAHKGVPSQIIEVSPKIIESLISQIEAAHIPAEIDLNIAPSSLTTIMASKLEQNEISSFDINELEIIYKKHGKEVRETAQQYNGTIISNDGTSFVVAFKSASAAITCALKIHKQFHSLQSADSTKLNLKIGISGCSPAHKETTYYNDTIKLAKRLCYISQKKILVTLEVKNLFQSKSLKIILQGDRLKTIPPEDVKFITLLMDYMAENWKDTNLHIDAFEHHLGASKSQIYRKMTSLIGQSPNAFIKEYRLNRAIELLKQKKGNISEIAFDTGFNSPSYFSKCFLKEYKIKPSDYLLNIERS